METSPGWRARIRGSKHHIAVREARAALASAHSAPEASVDIEELEILLRRVIESVPDVDMVPSADLLALVLDVAATAGAHAQFENDQGIIKSAKFLIDQLSALQRPTADLLLGLARYQSRFRVGGEDRQHSIERAVAESADDAERARALVILARFKIDSSDYRGARAVLDRCQAIIDDVDLREQYEHRIIVTRGMSYFYSNHEMARELFRRVAARGGRGPRGLQGREYI
jgi:hypothetical protein